MPTTSRESRARREAPAPVETDVATAVAVGTALWAVALLGLLPFWGWLSSTDRLWWLGVCAVGIALGLAGLPYSRRRQAAARRAQSLPDDGDRTSVR